MSLSSLAAQRDRVDAELRVQCLVAEQKTTKGGKPYFELSLADGSATVKLRVWDNHPAATFAASMKVGLCYALTGTWWSGEYGLESDRWQGRLLDPEERLTLFAGPPEVRAKQERDWQALTELVGAMPDGALKSLTVLLLTEHEEPFRRAAAARTQHHARRGGLVEHVSLMAQSAMALAGVYPELHRDLLLAGVVFHDCGKMVENQFQAEGFEMPFSFRAECYGHIAIGVQLAHKLWSKLPTEMQEQERGRLDALCHLILSHHGCAEWGSPVDPKLPEAAVLHYVDNMDAKLEMMRAFKAAEQSIAPGVLGKHWSLKVNLLEMD